MVDRIIRRGALATAALLKKAPAEVRPRASPGREAALRMQTPSATRPPAPGVRDVVADRRFFLFNAAVSVAALSLLAYLLLLRHGAVTTGADVSFLPKVNASLNALAATLLLCGYVAIKRRNWRVHRFFMVAAFAASSLFLVSYLVYHAVHGDTRYAGTGLPKTVYLVVLTSHVVLSATVVPLALTAFWFAFRKQFQRHTRVTRVLWPIWMYVSVTGVCIYFLLRNSYGGQ
jgi:putative membrane protein